jgi:probable rRNA maturation factor
MSLTLEWNNEWEEEISPQWIDQLTLLLNKAGEAEGVNEGEVALTFVDNKTIQELNQSYRGIDQPTDVLSFAMNDEVEDDLDIVFDTDTEELPPSDLLGDIIISVERAKQQSEEYGHSLEREIGFLFVHGFLHLLGYDHQDEEAEKIMFAKQERILNEVGLTR